MPRLVFTDNVRAVQNNNDEWELQVLGVPNGGHLGGRDSYGEYFTNDTRLWLGDPAPLPVIYAHGLDGEPSAVDLIGMAYPTKRDSKGQWFRVVLDKSKDEARKVWEAALEGLARASSGAISHLCEIDRKTGEIAQWILGELSLMDRREIPPANELAVALPALKSLYELAGLDTTSPVLFPDTAPSEGGLSAEGTGSEGNRIQPTTKAKGVIMLEELLKQIAAMIGEALAANGGEAPGAEDAADGMMAMTAKAEELVAAKAAEFAGMAGNEARQATQAYLDEHFNVLAETYLKAADEARSIRKQKADSAVKAWQKNAPATAKSDRAGGVVLPNIKNVTRGYDDSGKAGFLYYIKTGDRGALDATLKSSNVNPLESATDAQGAVTVPDDYLLEIIPKRDEQSILRKAGARVLQTSLDVVNIPVENGKMDYFVITGQESAVDEDEPTFSNVPVNVYTFTKLDKLSMQIVNDNKTNLDGYLADAAARAWARTENKYGLTGAGSGSTQPQGAIIGGTKGKDFASATAIAAGEVPDLLYALPAGYHDGAVWVARPATIGKIRQLGTSTFRWYEQTPNGTSASPTQAQSGAFGDVEGHAMLASQEVAAIAASAKSLLIGNFNFYALVERQELQVQRLVELYAGNGQIGLLWTVRMGGAVLQAEAFQYGLHPTS